MPTHHFTLIVDGPDLQDDALLGAVFEAGFDDAAIGRIAGIQFIDFDREASNLDQAILSAVSDLKRIDGVDVVRIADVGLELRHHKRRLSRPDQARLEALAGL